MATVGDGAQRVRVTVSVDTSALEGAAEALGTAGPTETVNAALVEARRRMLLERSARRTFTHLTPERLEQMRAPRALG